MYALIPPRVQAEKPKTIIRLTESSYKSIISDIIIFLLLTNDYPLFTKNVVVNKTRIVNISVISVRRTPLNLLTRMQIPFFNKITE